MLPKNFFKKLSSKIDEMEEGQKSLIFDSHNLKMLKKISEACNKSEKFIIISNGAYNLKSLIEMVDYFKLSVYYKRTHVTIFLTNFKGLKFTKFQDDRYRFLKMLYPNCNEFLKLSEKRDKFFEDMMK